MANEGTFGNSLSLVKDGAKIRKAMAPTLFDVASSVSVSGVQSIGTSEEAIDMGEVTAPGMAWFHNLDSTNYVEIRPGTGAADLVRLNAGETCQFRFAADCTAPYAIANTAAVKVEYLILSV